ncbi:MAG: starch synthase, partial [Pseudomonadota bacterium]
TGVLHAPDDADALTDAITKTIALHAEPGRWKTMRAQAMAQSVGWERSAAEYAALYREMVTDRAG